MMSLRAQASASADLSDRDVVDLARRYVELLGADMAREETNKARKLGRLADKNMDLKLAAESRFRSSRATDLRQRLLVAVDRMSGEVN